jgi:hypothetical protein
MQGWTGTAAAGCKGVPAGLTPASNTAIQQYNRPCERRIRPTEGATLTASLPVYLVRGHQKKVTEAALLQEEQPPGRRRRQPA